METIRISWLFALLTAAWFGWMAARASRSYALWAVGGAAFGLVASTLVLGLGRAASLPFSHHEQMLAQMKWLLVAVLIIAFIGWLLTSGLHRHHRSLSSKTDTDVAASGPNPNPPAAPTGSKPAPGKT